MEEYLYPILNIVLILSLTLIIKSVCDDCGYLSHMHRVYNEID